MFTLLLVNIGSGNGMLPDGTKPLSEPMLTYVNWNKFKWNFHQNQMRSVTKMHFKMSAKWQPFSVLSMHYVWWCPGSWGHQVIIKYDINCKTYLEISLSLNLNRSGSVFCLLLIVSSDYAQPITAQVTEVTCPVIGRAQPEFTPSKRLKWAQVWRSHYNMV